MRSSLSQYLVQDVGSSDLALLSSQPASPYCILVVPELEHIGYGLFRDAVIRFPPLVFSIALSVFPQDLHTQTRK